MILLNCIHVNFLLLFIWKILQRNSDFWTSMGNENCFNWKTRVGREMSDGMEPTFSSSYRKAQEIWIPL